MRRGTRKSLDGRGFGVEESRKDEPQHCNISLEVIRWWILLPAENTLPQGGIAFYDVKSAVVQMLLGLQLSEVHATLTYV